QPPQENKTSLPNLSNTLPPLVDSQSAPTETTITESSPSNITNNAVLKTPVVDPLTTTPQAGAFESPSCFTGANELLQLDKGWEGDKTFYQVPKYGMEDYER
ncbi:unnamed protein product, partial [Brassica rapa subsp. trilocularis]